MGRPSRRPCHRILVRLSRHGPQGHSAETDAPIGRPAGAGNPARRRGVIIRAPRSTATFACPSLRRPIFVAPRRTHLSKENTANADARGRTLGRDARAWPRPRHGLSRATLIPRRRRFPSSFDMSRATRDPCHGASHHHTMDPGLSRVSGRPAPPAQSRRPCVPMHRHRSALHLRKTVLADTPAVRTSSDMPGSPQRSAALIPRSLCCQPA